MLRRPPRLWTLLLFSNLAVLALPLTGLWVMRLYESALVRQTESELVAQAAVWASAYRQELRRTDSALLPWPVAAPGTPMSEAAVSILRRPGLDLVSDPVLPPPPDPQPPSQPPAASAAAVGAALAPMLHDAEALNLSALRITDANGIVVATTGADLGLSLIGWDEMAKVLAGAPVATAMRRRSSVHAAIDSISRTSGLRVFVALPVQGASGIAGVVVLSRTTRDVVQAIWDKRWTLAGLAVLLVAIGALLATGLSRLVTRPLAQVVAQAQRVAAGASAVPLARPGIREVADLSAALSQMATALDRRGQYIIAFAASVSHEFKTPLAGLRGAAELLEDHADTLAPTERARLLAIVSGNTARLGQLVRRLLELAHADMMRPGKAVATPVEGVLAGLLPRYRKAGMVVDYSGGTETVALSANALEAILASLLDNAAAYAGGSAVSVQIGATGGHTCITVADGGPGISSANRGRVFEPFFTTSRKAGGTGLGLSIARAIATGAAGTVELLESEQGAVFRIALPCGGWPAEKARA